MSTEIVPSSDTIVREVKLLIYPTTERAMSDGLDNREKSRFRPSLLSALLVLGVTFLIVFIWPTLYRYDHDRTALVRINRITGHAVYVDPD